METVTDALPEYAINIHTALQTLQVMHVKGGCCSKTTAACPFGLSVLAEPVYPRCNCGSHNDLPERVAAIMQSLPVDLLTEYYL